MTKNTIDIFPNEWKKWIAINLIKKISFEVIGGVLRDNGFSDAQIIQELQAASTSPYLVDNETANKENNRLLRRRNWLLLTRDSLARLDDSYSKAVDSIETPNFEYFIKHYYSQHKAVVLKNGIKHWDALKKWTPEYFATEFTDKQVQIQFNRESDSNFEVNSNGLKKESTMSEFVEMINSQESSNNFYMTANNTAQNIEAIREAFNDLGDFGEGYRELTNDPTFKTFFWMGPKGTFTPMHFDLTNNMLIQIYGTKKVTLIPAAQVPLIYNENHVFSDADFPNVDYSRYPLMRGVTPVEVILEAGDALFIPIGWWHCVDGLSKSISISFTNFNAPNDFSQSFRDIG